MRPKIATKMSHSSKKNHTIDYIIVFDTSALGMCIEAWILVL